MPEKFFDFILTIINAPLTPLIKMAQSLLTEQVNVELFHGLWGTMVYVISMFYGLYFIIAGFNLMISGYDAEKREKAKSWLKNTVLMVFFVQASYLLYSLVLELASGLSSGAMSLIDANFFLLTTDNLASIGLEIMLFLAYALVLLLTSLLLVLRYICVGVGVMFVPIGIFFYFTPMLEEYGKLILNALSVIIFLPFVQVLILLASSKLISMPIFANMKILVMISSFLFIDCVMILLFLFVIAKAAMSALRSDVGKTASMVYGKLT